MESLPRHNPGSNIPNPLALAHAVLLGGDEVAHSILFYVNGRRFQVSNAEPCSTLLTFLRENGFTDTKLGCGEGGCGACTVMFSYWDQDGQFVVNRSINACIFPLYQCDGAAITTASGIGSVRKGLHPIQERLAKGHGSQCGFCTPGFIMSLYTLFRNKPHATPRDVEECLDGNLCRCTGYRPILDASKSLCPCGKEGGCCGGGASSSSGATRDEPQEGDIFKPSLMSDFSGCAPLEGAAELIFPPELKKHLFATLDVRTEHGIFLRPLSLPHLLDIKDEYRNARLLAGNTELGIEVRFANVEVPVLVGVAHIPELNQLTLTDTHLRVGMSVNLSCLIENINGWVEELPKSKTRCLRALTNQLRWFASTQVRNVACLGGNIATASPISDMNPLWLALKATLRIESKSRGSRVLPIRDFFLGYRTTALQPDEVLVHMELPLTRENEFFCSYKQARRREDDIAIVNAGMRMLVEKDGDVYKVADCGFAFGGMSVISKVAKETEDFLIGRVFCKSTFEEAVQILMSEMYLDPKAPPGMIEYRRALCLSFFFKFFGHVCLKIATEDPSFEPFIPVDEAASAARLFHRPLSSGTQEYEVGQDPAIGQPIHHHSAELQVTGEAKYTDDVPKFNQELYGALVLTTRPLARIVSVDPSAALSLPGVVGFFDAKDVPGDNMIGAVVHDEETFVTTMSTSIGQPIGIVVAENEALAKEGARSVAVEYDDTGLTPILSIDDALEHNSFFTEPKFLRKGDVDSALQQCDHVLEADFCCGGQEHFYLECNGTIVIPSENDEYLVYCSTQAASKTQALIASVLGLPSNKVVCRVKRIGGGFGGKETRNVFIACAVAVPAYNLNRPVRLIVDRNVDMAITGQRHPFKAFYKVGFNSDGRIIVADMQLFNNAGYSMDLSLPVMDRALFHVDNAYNIPNMRACGRLCKTNLSSNTAFRGFGGPQGMIICEDMIDRVARFLGKPAHEVRAVNLYREGDFTHYGQKLELCRVSDVWNQLMERSGFVERLASVHRFNASSKYRKRGISIIPTKFGISFTAKFMNQGGALVHIYTDGSVLVTHGGIEMGQGLHTKMTQVAASCLKVPVSKVFISETATDKVPNQTASAASMSSDIYGMAVLDACQQLSERLQPYREQAGPGASWESIVSAAYFDRVNLSAQGFWKVPDLSFDWETGHGSPFAYFTNGAACTEVEVDCLTGDHHVLRTDIVMDLGNPLNPAIDVGQIEGAFVQGLGLFCLEEMVWGDSQHLWARPGRLHTSGPGTYKIPSANDIPIDFRIILLRDCPNPKAIHSSKAVGEPPLFLGSSALFAIKDAVAEYRQQNGYSGPFQLDSPCTAERIRMCCCDEIISHLFEKPEDAASYRAKGSF